VVRNVCTPRSYNRRRHRHHTGADVPCCARLPTTHCGGTDHLPPSMCFLVGHGTDTAFRTCTDFAFAGLAPPRTRHSDGSSFLVAFSNTLEGVANVSRGNRACRTCRRGCHEDAKRKLPPWNLSYTDDTRRRSCCCGHSRLST